MKNIKQTLSVLAATLAIVAAPIALAQTGVSRLPRLRPTRWSTRSRATTATR